MKTIIVWFRNDLRIHDNVTLSRALRDADLVIPVFILNKDLLKGGHSSSNRNCFLLECLQDLKQSFKKVGGDLLIREGDAATELLQLAQDMSAKAVYCTQDYTPYSQKRDTVVRQLLEKNNIFFKHHPGRLAVDSLSPLLTKTGKVFQIFTPFWRTWQIQPRREVLDVPKKIQLPKNITIGQLPHLRDITRASNLSPHVLPGGETAGRKRLQNFLRNDVKQYHEKNDHMAAEGTSRLSSYLHFGCISVREIEDRLPQGDGAAAFHRQLAWRDFYHYIIFHFPDNANKEFREKYRSLKWGDDPKLLAAWQNGKTGYPIVDAAMRQLNQEGWMHNRARLIVGSFLTKDLWLDWRLGEQYFMKRLIDGDEANNNGNWQWIASVGVDPAPVFRRIFNPTTQAKNYDPEGIYIKRYVPELSKLPDKYLFEPWTTPEDIQKEVHCIIGKDYPDPIVDHKAARTAALERFRSVA